MANIDIDLGDIDNDDMISHIVYEIERDRISIDDCGELLEALEATLTPFVEEISAESIIEWLSSPFVSEYDKKMVIDSINQKPVDTNQPTLFT